MTALGRKLLPTWLPRLSQTQDRVRLDARSGITLTSTDQIWYFLTNNTEACRILRTGLTSSRKYFRMSVLKTKEERLKRRSGLTNDWMRLQRSLEKLVGAIVLSLI